MKPAVVAQNRSAKSVGQAWAVRSISLCLLPFAAIVSSCGGGSAGSGGDSLSQVPPLVAIGQQRQYVGTATRSVVYANPTAAQQNNTLEYTHVENQMVQQAPAEAPADFDVQSSFTFTVVRNPGVGVVPVSETADTYENLLSTSDSQQVETWARRP